MPVMISFLSDTVLSESMSNKYACCGRFLLCTARQRTMTSF